MRLLRRRTCRSLALLVMCAPLMLLAPISAAVGDDAAPRVTAAFTGEQLEQVLEELAAQYALEFSLDAAVDPLTPINATVIDFPLEQALPVLFEPAGLCVTAQDGGWLITVAEPAEQPARDEFRPTVGPATPPAPVRTTGAYEPRRAPASEDAAADDEEERAEVIDVVFPDHFGAATAAMIFGGGVIDPGAQFGMTGTTGGYAGTTGGFSGSTAGFGGATTGGSVGTTTGFAPQGGFGGGQGLGRGEGYGAGRAVR